MGRPLELARAHGLEMLLYARLRRHYARWGSCIDDYLDQTRDAYLRTVARAVRQEAVERGAVAALAEQDIPACVLKGTLLARQLYGDPHCRGSFDIDLLVRSRDLERADRVMCEHGFTRLDRLPLAFLVGRLHHVSYLDPAHRFRVDLHWDFGIPGYLDLDSERIWQGVVRDEAGGCTLTRSWTVTYLLIHQLRHCFRDLKTLVDVLWAFHTWESSIDWRQLAGELAAIGLTRTAVIVLDQLEALWPDRAPQMAAFAALRADPAIASTQVPRFLLRRFRIDLDRAAAQEGPVDRLLAKLALDHPSRVAFAFAKVLFPRPSEIRALYPDLARARLPLGYLRFIHWRVRTWAGK